MKKDPKVGCIFMSTCQVGFTFWLLHMPGQRQLGDKRRAEQGRAGKGRAGKGREGKGREGRERGEKAREGGERSGKGRRVPRHDYDMLTSRDPGDIGHSWSLILSVLPGHRCPLSLEEGGGGSLRNCYANPGWPRRTALPALTPIISKPICGILLATQFAFVLTVLLLQGRRSGKHCAKSTRRKEVQKL